jgi:hypothetical protein
MSTAMKMLMLVLPLSALAADDPRVTRLEQEVRTLQREVQSLSRQLEQQHLQSSRPPPPPDGRSPPSAAPAPPDLTWLDAARWRQLRIGMSELEVIALLGRPNSIRKNGATHEMLYAMEIGPAAFLGGAVMTRDGVVTEVRQPVLK